MPRILFHTGVQVTMATDASKESSRFDDDANDVAYECVGGGFNNEKIF